MAAHLGKQDRFVILCLSVENKGQKSNLWTMNPVDKQTHHQLSCHRQLVTTIIDDEQTGKCSSILSQKTNDSWLLLPIH